MNITVYMMWGGREGERNVQFSLFHSAGAVGGTVPAAMPVAVPASGNSARPHPSAPQSHSGIIHSVSSINFDRGEAHTKSGHYLRVWY